MSQGIGVVGIFVHDQEQARAFYVDQVGFVVHTDVQNGPFRWLTLQHPEQPSFQLGIFAPGPPLHDAGTEQALRALVAKGAMPGMVLHVNDCAATVARMKAAGVEFTQEAIERFGNIDAGFRDPSGNGWKIIQLAR
jgi:catechol 2,3-dioxygenase-like lactoylglutathione lyase family enzyme